MSSSIFDNLQIIQVTDDDSTNLYHNPIPHENIDFNHHPEDAEQTAHLKVSTSTKPSAHMVSSWSQKSKSSLTKHTLPPRQSIKQENTTNPHQNTTVKTELKKLNEKDQFTCQSCAHQPDELCQICQGKVKLTGNDRMVKFFEYVMEFKLGKRQSYKPREEKIKSKRTAPNEHCSIYFSTIDPKTSVQKESQPKVRFSLCNDNPRPISTIQPCDLGCNKQIHYGYGCDQCQTDPIEGPRFHCNECGDFDLCEACYQRTNHYHELEKIEIKQNKKALEKISNLLKVTNQSGIRSTLKNGGGIRNTMASKGTKSWIR